MKAAPTLDGRIRVDLESPHDLMILQAILHDAGAAGIDLADRLTEVMDEGEDDWEDFVVPDLRDQFHSQLGTIERALAPLSPDGADPLFILKDDAADWYGGLNQARLALEARYGLAGTDPEGMTPGKRSAWFRSQFYQTLQGMMLRFLMQG